LPLRVIIGFIVYSMVLLFLRNANHTKGGAQTVTSNTYGKTLGEAERFTALVLDVLSLAF